MTLMRKVKSSEGGFGIIEILVIAVILTVLTLIGLHAAATDKKTLLVSAPTIGSGSKTNISNTYDYKNNVLPNLPTNYQLLNQTVLSGGQSEADYITSATATQVHSAVMALCKADQFNFDTTADPDTNIECDGSYNWQFNILPASDLLDQSWYTFDQFSETQLSQMVFLQVQSSPVVCNCPEMSPASVSSSDFSKYCSC
jgi:hypothetical protein